jgi:hypothetical protein
MKYSTLLTVFLILGCSQQSEQLSVDEIEQIKKTIIERSNKHAQDLEDLNYPEIMTFYADIDDYIVFGDGYYWGDYKTIDGIWHDFTVGVKKVEKFDFFNHKIHVFSKDVASCFVEFDHERIDGNGNTTKGHGSFSFSMQNIDGDWKAVSSNATHNFNVYDENGEVRKWWLYYSPENRKEEE